jgi:hypothetical protein
MVSVVKPKALEIQPEPHVKWDVEDTVLTVGEGEDTVIIDLSERQEDGEAVIDICRGPNGLMEGLNGAYVLSVEIPPRRYKSSEPEPLDIASVTVRLWTDEREGTNVQEGGIDI